MKKITLLSIIPILAFMGPAFGVCSDGLNEKVWDKTPSGYCKIFFPDCEKDTLGKRMSYARDVSPEVVCIGHRGEYSDFYKVSIKEANEVFGTNFEKMGVNYSSELSKWLFDNCGQHCGHPAVNITKATIVATEIDVSAKEQEEEAQAYAEKAAAEAKSQQAEIEIKTTTDIAPETKSEDAIMNEIATGEEPENRE